jgi:hypothetical protein
MFNAALEILYAGAGEGWCFLAHAMEPNVDVLLKLDGAHVSRAVRTLTR